MSEFEPSTTKSVGQDVMGYPFLALQEVSQGLSSVGSQDSLESCSLSETDLKKRSCNLCLVG